MKRPVIKDHFIKETLHDMLKVYTKSPKLFDYAKSLDGYCDHLEAERDNLKKDIFTISSTHHDLTKEIFKLEADNQILKGAIKELRLGYEDDFNKLKSLIK